MSNRPDAAPELAWEREYPPELLRRFELLECFCDKGDSRTLLARERSGETLAVVKCFLKGGPLYDRTEPEALRALDAAPLPRFIAEYRGEDMRCVLREYVPGRTLAEAARERPFSRAEIIAIGVQLCDQLAALHGHQPPVVHRDIKPQNVVVGPDGQAVLIDFGISRVVSGAAGDTLVFGTQGFSPPEQYGFAQTDSRSDIFALGVLLNWLLRGETKLPEKASTPLERVARRCAAFDPRERYPTVERVRAALRAAAPAARRRRGLLAALAAVCAAALLALAWAGLRSAEGVRLAEPLVERAARMNLGLEAGEPLTRERLAEVTGLYIVADEAYPGPDEFYPAVNRWYAGGRSVWGEVRDLSDLALMPNLRQVCVAVEEVEDISVLAGLEQLDKVELKHNAVADISPLAGKEKLTSVGLNGNPVRDLSPLETCPRLAFLDLCDVRTYDASVIGRLGNFDFLDLSNPTDSYNYLAGKSVKSLALSWTGLTDLSALDGVTRLESLSIGHTALTDLSPLTRHAGLVELNIAAIPAEDLSPLLALPLLQRVTVSGDMLPRVEALGEVGFEVAVEG